MNNLTIYDNKVVISSRLIAQELNKEHTKVIRSLDKIVKEVSPNVATPQNFIKTEYTNKQNKQKYTEYLLTKDGFTLYMFNIQGYNEFKMAYINRFNEMEQQLKTSTTSPIAKRLYWKGQPVMTIDMLAKQLNLSAVTVNKRLKQIQGFAILVGEDLTLFKRENKYTSPCNALIVVNHAIALELAIKLGKMNSLGNYFTLSIDKFKLPIEEMKIAVEQARILLSVANGLSKNEMQLKDALFKTITRILYNIGLWDNVNDVDYNINTLLGWNKLAIMENNYRELKLI